MIQFSTRISTNLGKSALINFELLQLSPIPAMKPLSISSQTNAEYSTVQKHERGHYTQDIFVPGVGIEDLAVSSTEDTPVLCSHCASSHGSQR